MCLRAPFHFLVQYFKCFSFVDKTLFFALSLLLSLIPVNFLCFCQVLATNVTYFGDFFYISFPSTLSCSDCRSSNPKPLCCHRCALLRIWCVYNVTLGPHNFFFFEMGLVMASMNSYFIPLFHKCAYLFMYTNIYVQFINRNAIGKTSFSTSSFYFCHIYTDCLYDTDGVKLFSFVQMLC